MYLNSIFIFSREFGWRIANLMIASLTFARVIVSSLPMVYQKNSESTERLGHLDDQVAAGSLLRLLKSEPENLRDKFAVSRKRGLSDGYQQYHKYQTHSLFCVGTLYIVM